MTEIDALARPILTPEELRACSRRNPLRATLGILRVFGLTMGTIIVAAALGGWWVVPAVVVMGALQHAISILQHEAVHGLLFRTRWLNDGLGRFLLSYPIGFSLDYRRTHFAHHRHLGTAEDPDAHNYAPFPSSRAHFFRKVADDFSGVGAVRQFFGQHEPDGGPSHVWGIAFTQVVIFLPFFLSGHPWLYAVLWLLPLVTFAKGFAQLRNMAEHLSRPQAPSGSERLRTFQSNVLERFFLAPLNFHYHAEHHWYTGIPYYRLPQLRRTLRGRTGYQEHAEWSPSYWSVLRRAASSV